MTQLPSPLYKVLYADGTPCHGGSGAWSLPTPGKPGAWRHVTGPLVVCRNGLHLCTAEQVLDRLGPAIFTVETVGERLDAESEIVVRRARLLARIETWTDQTARLFACDCADRALAFLHAHDIDVDARTVDAIAVARRFAQGTATPAQLDAAATAVAAATAETQKKLVGEVAYSAAYMAANAVANKPLLTAATAALTARHIVVVIVAERFDVHNVPAAALHAERTWQHTRLWQYLNGDILPNQKGAQS